MMLDIQRFTTKSGEQLHVVRDDGYIACVNKKMLDEVNKAICEFRIGADVGNARCQAYLLGLTHGHESSVIDCDELK